MLRVQFVPLCLSLAIAGLLTLALSRLPGIGQESGFRTATMVSLGATLALALAVKAESAKTTVNLRVIGVLSFGAMLVTNTLVALTGLDWMWQLIAVGLISCLTLWLAHLLVAARQ